MMGAPDCTNDSVWLSRESAMNRCRPVQLELLPNRLRLDQSLPRMASCARRWNWPHSPSGRTFGPYGVG